MFFTQEDYLKIESWLKKRTIKDTEFNNAETPLKGNEMITLIQNGTNVKTYIKDFITQLFAFGINDFLNITSLYNKRRIALNDAIELVPYTSRKVGQVITFCDEDGNWQIYQYIGESLLTWNNLTLWKDIIQAIAVAVNIVPDEEDVTGVTEGEATVIKFKNKRYDSEEYSGLGRVYLRKNIQTVDSGDAARSTNLLTQSMFLYTNSIYIVQYDYDLNGSIINVPTGSILDFQGGSLNNGTINFPEGTYIRNLYKGTATITGNPTYIDYLADEEDVTTENGILKFKDKEHSSSDFSGLGRKYLRKNIIDGKNILTQEMISNPNTRYIIQYDYDLNEQEIIIPENCVLQFEGGSFNNGTINFINTYLSSDVKFTSINILGSIKNGIIHINWFGLDSTGNIDVTQGINNILKISEHKEVIFDGIYKVNPVINTINIYDGGITPISNQTLRFINNSKVVIDPQTSAWYSLIGIYEVENVNIIGANLEGDVESHLGEDGEFGFGIAIAGSENINIYNCTSNKQWGDGFAFLSAVKSEKRVNNFNCKLIDCKSSYNRRQGLSIVALYNGLIDNFEASYTGTIKYTAPSAGIDIEPNGNYYDERIKVIINNYTSSNNIGGALHFIISPLTAYHSDEDTYLEAIVNNMQSYNDGHTANLYEHVGNVYLPVIRYSGATTYTDKSHRKIQGGIMVNNISIVKPVGRVFELRNCYDNGIIPTFSNIIISDSGLYSDSPSTYVPIFINNSLENIDWKTEYGLFKFVNLNIINTDVNSKFTYLIFNSYTNYISGILIDGVKYPRTNNDLQLIPYFINKDVDIKYTITPEIEINKTTLLDVLGGISGYNSRLNVKANSANVSIRLPKSSSTNSYKTTVCNKTDSSDFHVILRWNIGEIVNYNGITNYNSASPSIFIKKNQEVYVELINGIWYIYSGDIIETNPSQFLGDSNNILLDSIVDSGLNYGHVYVNNDDARGGIFILGVKDYLKDTPDNTRKWYNSDSTDPDKVIIV